MATDAEKSAANSLTAAGAATANPYLVAAGLALSIIGGISSRKAEKRAHRANQRYLASQAIVAERAHKRASDIFTRESTLVIGQRVSAISRSGVAFNANVAEDLASDRMLQFKELASLKDNSEQQQALFRMQIAQEGAQIRATRRAGPIMVASDILGTYANNGQAMQNWNTIRIGNEK